MSKKPNPYLAKQQAMMQSAFEIGEEMGMQRMWDYVQVALRCPEVMGKDTVGNTRMKRLYKKNGRACQRVPGCIHPRSRS